MFNNKSPSLNFLLGTCIIIISLSISQALFFCLFVCLVRGTELRTSTWAVPQPFFSLLLTGFHTFAWGVLGCSDYYPSTSTSLIAKTTGANTSSGFQSLYKPSMQQSVCFFKLRQGFWIGNKTVIETSLLLTLLIRTNDKHGSVDLFEMSKVSFLCGLWQGM
jgi:hypothetical protein